jgi:hypothetical protein
MDSKGRWYSDKEAAVVAARFEIEPRDQAELDRLMSTMTAALIVLDLRGAHLKASMEAGLIRLGSSILRVVRGRD